MSELLDGSQGLGQMSDSEAEDETTRVSFGIVQYPYFSRSRIILFDG